jgi:hypothetical protein
LAEHYGQPPTPIKLAGTKPSSVSKISALGIKALWAGWPPAASQLHALLDLPLLSYLNCSRVLRWMKSANRPSFGEGTNRDSARKPLSKAI